MLVTFLGVGLAILAYVLLTLRVGMSSMSFKQQVILTLNGQNNITGSDYNPITAATTISKSIATGNTIANASAGGGDEIYSALSSITASSSVSIDVTNITDFLATAAVNLARIKGITLRLLSVADDATNGTAATSVTVDGTVANALLSSSSSGWLTNSTSKFDVAGGDYVSWGTVGAAGIVVSGTNKVIKILNNDSGHTAKVQLTMPGGSS